MKNHTHKKVEWNLPAGKAPNTGQKLHKCANCKTRQFFCIDETEKMCWKCKHKEFVV